MRATFSIQPCTRCQKTGPCATVDIGTTVSLCQECADQLMKVLFRAHPFISKVVKPSYPQRVIAFLDRCTCERVRRYPDCPVHGEAVRAKLNECPSPTPSQGVQVPPAI